MFKKFIKMLSLLMVLMIGLSLISCGKGPKRFVSGDFVYTKWECDEGEVRIIGLSEEGQKKENLIFPAMIDGYVVHSIGVRFGFKIINDVVITNAKNVYFPSGYIQPKGVSYKLNEDIISLNVYIGESKAWRSNLYPSLKSLPNIDLKVYVSEQFYNLVTNGDEEKNIFEQKGTVVYYLDEETTFFVDDVNKAKVNVVPPIPYKEGYTFDGWYKDLDYIEKWDFDKDLVPEKIYDEEGNYQFIETKIYAKWK